MTHAIQVNALSKSFGNGWGRPGRPVLREVSFHVPPGSMTGFVGGNGQGKTTTLKCLLEFIRPDGGEAFFFGGPLRAAKNRVGFLPERPYLYEFLTGRELLRFHWRLAGLPSAGFFEACRRVLASVGLEQAADRRLREYSKGMLQRMGLAQALIHGPEILILDEPMSGLDPDGRLMVKDILRDQHRAGVTIFFSSHLLVDMDELCSHLVVIDAGAIVFNGPPNDFRRAFPSLEEAFRVFRRDGGAAR